MSGAFAFSAATIVFSDDTLWIATRARILITSSQLHGGQSVQLSLLARDISFKEVRLYNPVKIACSRRCYASEISSDSNLTLAGGGGWMLGNVTATHLTVSNADHECKSPYPVPVWNVSSVSIDHLWAPCPINLVQPTIVTLVNVTVSLNLPGVILRHF